MKTRFQGEKRSTAPENEPLSLLPSTDLFLERENRQKVVRESTESDKWGFACTGVSPPLDCTGLVKVEMTELPTLTLFFFPTILVFCLAMGVV